MNYRVNLNTARSRIAGSNDDRFRREEAKKFVRLFLTPRDGKGIVADSEVPDYLVTESMVDRFLLIDPPEFRVLSTFDAVIDEIERAYVVGLLFSALSAAVVTIERVLNEARIRLHEHATPKIKDLWEKVPLNEWERNIEALDKWGYLPAGLPNELRDLYIIRCNYLHSGGISSLGADTLRAVNGVYNLLRALIGFPGTLFEIGPGIRCFNEQDPLFKAFYAADLSNEHS